MYGTKSGEDVHAVHGVDLDVIPGEFVAVMGASGSGKTTLLNLLAGLDVATSGEINVCGHTLTGMSEDERGQFRLRHLGVVFQDNNLLDEFSAVENVMLPMRALGVGRDQAMREAMESLERMGVAQVAERRPEQMSGGQRQRVGIARALAGSKTLLLADEPTGALDAANSETLFGVLSGLTRQDVTVVVVSHDPMIRRFASRTVEMSDGQLIE